MIAYQGGEYVLTPMFSLSIECLARFRRAAMISPTITTQTLLAQCSGMSCLRTQESHCSMDSRSCKSPIDANGFFNFANVEPGTYTSELKPQNHGRRLFSDVIVGTGVTTQFRGTTISKYPFPVFSTSPKDGATSVDTGISD